MGAMKLFSYSGMFLEDNTFVILYFAFVGPRSSYCALAFFFMVFRKFGVYMYLFMPGFSSSR